MLTVNKRLPAGQSLAPALLKRAATVTLDWDVRQKSRFDATDSQGRRLAVFLPRGTQVRGGDVLVAEDGSLVKVEAAAQPVLVVTHCRDHGTPFDLLRAAYHLGNRHVALDLQPDRLLLEPDHVLARMLRQMHLIVTEAEVAFEPEGGAYAAHASGAAHGHADHSHAHSHAHSDAHGHAQEHAQGHISEPGGGHGHGHAKHGDEDHGHTAPSGDHGHAKNHDHDHDHGHGHGHGDGHRH